MSFSKIVFVAAVLSIFTATAFAEETETESDSEWDKILSAGIQVAGSKFYYKDASDDYNYITTDGFGWYTQYMSINKNNGFGFLLNGSLTIFVTDDLGHDNDIGTLFNTYAGVGFSPVHTNRLSLLLTAGIGGDAWMATTSRYKNDTAIAEANLGVGADISFSYRISKKVGIGVNLLGTYDLFGYEIIDYDYHIHSTREEFDNYNTSFIRKHGFNIIPSAGITVHF